MRGAPPVQMACGPDAPWRWFIRSLHVLVLCTLAAWWVLRAEGGPVVLWTAVAVAGACAWVLSSIGVPRDPDRILAWDGQRWTLQGQAGDVAVMVDLGCWLLLRVSTEQGQHWIALSWRAGTGSGNGFRAALQAHAGHAPGGILEGRVRDADG